MGARFAGLVSHGPLPLAVGAAALAGLVSFLSPCVLPLVPGYLSYVTGLAGAELDAARNRSRMLAGTGLFVLGFTAVYTTMAVLFASVGGFLFAHARALEIGIGVLVVVFGLAFLGLVPGFQRELRVHRLPEAGLLGAPVFGAVFALSWVPCVGPTLGAVLALAAVGGRTDRAIVLAAAYCLGLGVPFVVFGVGFRRLLGLFRAVRRNSRWVTRVGGALLILVGLALITGGWADFITWLRSSVGVGEVSL